MKLLNEILKEVESDFNQKHKPIVSQNVGFVSELMDEIVFIEGLENAKFGELLDFGESIIGMVIDLTEEFVGAIIFGDYTKIREGAKVAGTGHVLSISVSNDFIGRVVDGIGNPIDEKGFIKGNKDLLVDSIAPGVIDRKHVDTPIQTGIKAIDGLIPIGRGQRELIIGDRRTGKTTIAIDTILNQKEEKVICIYVAIGQKKSSIASIVDLLAKEGAMSYTIIVAASGSDSASLQYIAPYTATAIGEYFLHQGKDVLIVYDDLTKHAWAYRQISLVLRRPAGREAYPGDVFYLHSRLLERACKLNSKLGGGSITALPIIETQEGDLSAYIPTNVISITDGQIVLESDLFNAGIRPAINIGASVSRVGGAAQTKAMKKVAGKLKLELAQYREMAAFSQFESELDEKTKLLIDRGARLTQLIRQVKHKTYSVAHQVILFWIGTNGYLDTIPLNELSSFEEKCISYFNLKHKKLIKDINTKKSIDTTIEKELKEIVVNFIKLYFK